MRSAILRSLAVIGAGALVLVGVLYVASTVDGRSPSVLEVRLTQPAGDDERLALVTSTVEVVFSEPVDAASAEAAVAFLPATPVAASWSGSTMILTPVEPLALDTEYSVVVDEGILDLAGNEMGDPPPPFEFVTLGSPALDETDPADGAADVPLDATVTLTFTTLMDTASVEEALSVDPVLDHDLRWSGRVLEIIPNDLMAPDADYRISISDEATDVTGVPLTEAIALSFRTVAAGLESPIAVPANADGIATSSPIGLVFGEPIDPASATDELITITPEVAGSVEVIPLPGDPASDDDAGRALVFVPSAPLPANTTFTVVVTPGMVAVSGARLGAPISWTFTTGVPTSTVSNQITFLSDLGGITNLWATNADGSGTRQLSSELMSVLDYAVAPDGDSFVVADGWRLVSQGADGSERQVLTGSEALEFDPAYSPDGRTLTFARADAVTGAGLGLWEREVGGGEAEPLELPDAPGSTASPTDATDADAAALRAPRYSPDGEALAFVDAAGAVGVLELAAERLTLAELAAAGAPTWLPDSSALLVTGQRSGAAATDVAPPVQPLIPGLDDAVLRVARAGGSVTESPFGTGSHVVAVALDGSIAYVAEGGALWLTDDPATAAAAPAYDDEPVLSATFGPSGKLLVLEVASGRLELFDPATGEASELAASGARPRWLP